MIEVATDTRTKEAFRAAHDARGQALNDLWAWLTKSSHSD